MTLLIQEGTTTLSGSSQSSNAKELVDPNPNHTSLSCLYEFAILKHLNRYLFIYLFIYLQLLNQYVNFNFRAINYFAEVYVNGHKTSLPKGMFRRHTLDVTDILHPENDSLLAVIVHPPDHPGTIPPKGGQGGDHEVHYTSLSLSLCAWHCFFLTKCGCIYMTDWERCSCSVCGRLGLDLSNKVNVFVRRFSFSNVADNLFSSRDRNTGIWDEVSISVTGVSFVWFTF